MVDPVDLTNLRDLTEGDVELEKELFEEFISSCEDAIQTMEANCLNGENKAWRAAAHAVKGTSLNLGADKLSELCKIGQDNQDATAEEKLDMLEEIKSAYAEVKEYLLAIH